MVAPPYTGDSDLDAFLYDVYINGTDSTGSGFNANTTSGEITDAEGNLLGYLYQYMSIKYADSNTGAGMSNTPTNKAYYGTHNSNSTTESTNPADYTWYEVAGTFGTTRNLYYYIIGGRQIKFDVNTSPIDYHWLLDSGAVINLDLLVPPQTITASELLDAAVTELKLANAAVTASKTNIAAISNTTGNLVANSVGTTQITDDAVTSQKIIANAIVAGKIAANAVQAVNIEANAVTADKIAANAVTANKIVAGAVTADKVSVSNLSAINANMGSITAGTINAGNTTNGVIISADNQTIKVYNNGVLRVQIGNLSI